MLSLQRATLILLTLLCQNTVIANESNHCDGAIAGAAVANTVFTTATAIGCGHEGNEYRPATIVGSMAAHFAIGYGVSKDSYLANDDAVKALLCPLFISMPASMLTTPNEDGEVPSPLTGFFALLFDICELAGYAYGSSQAASQ